MTGPVFQTCSFFVSSETSAPKFGIGEIYRLVITFIWFLLQKKELASGTTWQHITTMVAIFAQPKVTQRSKSSNVVSPIMNIMNILMVIWYWVIINIKLSGWWLPIELQWITMNLTFSQEHPHLSRGWSLSPAAYLQRSLRILWSQAWLSPLMMENIEFSIREIWPSRLL